MVGMCDRQARLDGVRTADLRSASMTVTIFVHLKAVVRIVVIADYRASKKENMCATVGNYSTQGLERQGNYVTARV